VAINLVLELSIGPPQRRIPVNLFPEPGVDIDLLGRGDWVGEAHHTLLLRKLEGESPKNFVGMIEFIAVSSGQAKKWCFSSAFISGKTVTFAAWRHCVRGDRGDHIADGIVSANPS